MIEQHNFFENLVKGLKLWVKIILLRNWIIYILLLSIFQNENSIKSWMNLPSWRIYKLSCEPERRRYKTGMALIWNKSPTNFLKILLVLALSLLPQGGWCHVMTNLAMYGDNNSQYNLIEGAQLVFMTPSNTFPQSTVPRKSTELRS